MLKEVTREELVGEVVVVASTIWWGEGWVRVTIGVPL